METLEALGKLITTTKDLRSIVHTMKSLSAVSIRQYEQAAIALQDYARTIELGLSIVLREKNAPEIDVEISSGPTIAIIFGSDHGLCGRFNYNVVDFARKEMQRHCIPKDRTLYLVAGSRAVAQLEAENETVEDYIFLPGAVSGLTETAHNLLLKVDRWRVERNTARTFLFYNSRSGQVKVSPHSVQLLPIDSKWIQNLAQRRWTSRTIPTFTMAPEILFAALVRQHLFISLFRAGAESAAGEHAMRLAAMQAAGSHIDDHLDELNAAYRRKRQESITEELLDVIAGFEVLSGSPKQYL